MKSLEAGSRIPARLVELQRLDLVEERHGEGRWRDGDRACEICAGQRFRVRCVRR